MTRIICISAGQLQTKKSDSAVNRRNLYLNYGLLSLASVLERHRYQPIVIHGGYSTPEATLALAVSYGLLDTVHPVLLSVPSFYALEWAQRFISLLKELKSSSRVIVGGRWVVGDDPERLRRHIPNADLIVSGLAEQQIVSLVSDGQFQSRSVGELSSLSYRLLHGRELYQPSIEVARGCGMRCVFCQDGHSRRSALKAPGELVAELRETLLDDGLIEMTPYFEAAMFVPKFSWVNQLSRALEENEMQIRWRTEARVDTLRADLIQDLARCGLTVLDLGLESASPKQLIRMGKSQHPEKYLEKASVLLEACARHGIKVKANVLLYAGETDETLSETTDWLDRHRESIFGVSVNPVIVYGWQDMVQPFLAELASQGASPAFSPCDGVTEMNLSACFDHQQAKNSAKEISQRYMPTDNYYWLKSFSYFPRNYSLEDFSEDLRCDSMRQGFSPAPLELTNF